MSTTRVHARPAPVFLPGERPARTRGTRYTASARRAPGPGPRSLPPRGCAHKDPDLRNTRRTQGRNQAAQRDPVLPNSRPCVRHQGEWTLKTDMSRGGPTVKTADPRRKSGWFPAAPIETANQNSARTRRPARRGRRAETGKTKRRPRGLHRRLGRPAKQNGAWGWHRLPGALPRDNGPTPRSKATTRVVRGHYPRTTAPHSASVRSGPAPPCGAPSRRPRRGPGRPSPRPGWRR